MRHRLRSATLCALLLLGLSACGGTNSPAADAPPAEVSSAPHGTSSSSQPPLGTPDALEPVENATGKDNGEQKTDVSSQPSEELAPVQSEGNGTSDPEASSVQTSQPELPAGEAQKTEQERKILIAYFTWAENTVVEDPSAVDADAATSASVLAPGHVAQMASWIQGEIGGELFSIAAAEPYSSDYDECLDRAADEKADSARPALSGTIENMAGYDVIFIGYPDWWATCPMAVFTFLDSYDFTGKTVIPFCAHGTSGLASSVRDIKAALPGVTVLDAVGVQRPGMDTPLDAARSTVANWLAGLEY